MKTFKNHKRLFFNSVENKWFNVSSATPSFVGQSDSDSDILSFGSSSSSDENDSEVVFESENEEMTADTHAAEEVLSELEVEYWGESDSEIEQDVESSPSPSLPPDITASPTPEKKYEPLVWWIVVFVCIFQTLHSISDRAVAWLLRFIGTLLQYLGSISPQIKSMAESFPKSVYLRDKFISGDVGNCHFKKYVSCPSCHTLYHFNNCIEKTGAVSAPKKCTNVTLFNVCNAYLVKQVVSKSGSLKFYPFKTYCYSSCISTLQRFLLRPGFADLCEQNRKSLTRSDGKLSDVHHGKIWSEFLRFDRQNFLSMPLCYGVMLNVDWFQPFDHHTYSIGVLYLVLMNLPRTQRYKRQNVIIIGVIPGPSEPPLLINTYLSPLVKELKQLWDGVLLKLPDSSEKIVRVALLAVACDMPASRKVCGFLSHSANLGCPRCYCEFSKGGLNRDYSNFDRSSWTYRSNSKHRKDVENMLKNPQKSKSALSKLESQMGCRYSVLLELSYFDPIRMTIVDPMHNLFLGSAKHVTKNILIGTGILKKVHLDVIHRRIRSAQIPLDMGRLPSRIDSGSTFTAQQWMNWTLYFSVYCLYDLLNTEQIECWRAFVLACRRLCKLCISEEDIKVSDLLLNQFCKRIKRVFGSKFVTPNMHMHLHLADCLRDYGPLHAFWLYSFERYNGLLGNQPTNNRAIELQLIHRFERDNLHIDLLSVAESMPLAKDFRDIVCGHALQYQSTSESVIVENEDNFQLPKKYTFTVLDGNDLTQLRQVYAHLHPERATFIQDVRNAVPSTCKRYTHVNFCGKKLSSASEHNEGKVPYALAIPIAQTESSSTSTNVDPRPAHILYFVKHSWIIPELNEEPHQYSHTFAVCKWPQEHPDQNIVGKPVQVWCKSLSDCSINPFVPAENIVSRLIVAYECINNESVLVVIPLL